MEQTLTAWLLPAITLVAGIAIGFLIARLAPNAAPSRTQRQLDEMQERFDAYQSEVVSHFNTTASMVKKLTQSYQEVQEHLSEGANRLALDELTRQPMQVVGHAIRPALAPVLFPSFAATEGMEDMLDAAESPAKAVAS